MKKVLFLLLLISSSVFAQKVEHGILAGASLGFPLQDKNETPAPPVSDFFLYNNDLFGGGMIGYRFRFLPEQKTFFDLDLTAGFQSLGALKYKPYMNGGDPNNGYGHFDGEDINDFLLPIAVTATWNYRFTDKFHAGLGVAPKLYVQPHAAFDLSVVAKMGYRVCKHFELGLSYQYGCLNVMKHFNDGKSQGRKGHLSDLMLSVYIPFSVK